MPSAKQKIFAIVNYLTTMQYQNGELVIVLDTTQKAVGSAVVQVYHPELHSYTVLFQYPGKPAPELVPLPAHRLLRHPDAKIA